MKKNKWVIEIADSYTVNGKNITRTDTKVIPPTSGNRTDIIGESGKYYYGMTREEFFSREDPIEYLNRVFPGLSEKQKQMAIKSTDWTPRKYHDRIAIVIDIKDGEPHITHK